jgi:4-amino-4-deoxy-L-arabinose transferase-like glycosyltransferase
VPSLRVARPRSASIVLAAILAVAAAVRIWGLTFGLPHTQTRPDETQIIDITLYFLRGDFKPPFYDYPWLYMWVLTGLYLVYYVWGVVAGAFTTVADLVASWPVNWEPFFLISRAMSAVAGTATVFVVYRLGRTLWDESTGLVAAFFLSLTFLHVRDSHFGTTDVTMTLLIVMSVSLLMSAHLTGRRSLFAMAGAVGGLATGTKYSAVFLAAPMLASQTLHVIDSPGRRVQAAFDGRILWFGVPFAAVLSIGIPFVLLDSDRFWLAMSELRKSMQYGTPHLDLESGWLHHLKFSLRYGLGLPLLIAAFIGAAALLIREPRVGLLLLAFPLSYYLVAGSMRNLFFRYTIPLIPFLCVTAAWLVTASVRRLTPRLFAAAATIAAVLIVLPSATSVWQFNRIISRTDNRVVVADWFKARVPPASSVLQSGSLWGYAQIDNRIWQHWTWDRQHFTFTLNGRPATGRPDWILVQESPLPSTTQDVVKGFLKEDYELAWQFTALSLGDDRVYDLQDAFFVPFAGFRGVRRPGPNFTLYKRSTAVFRDEPPAAP